MTDLFQITRQIGIDMGHRVPDHMSKCRSPHGHRYTIEATCVGHLAVEGSESGMVMDFGFLKEEMLIHIDRHCDHAFCIGISDRVMHRALIPDVSITYLMDELETEGFSHFIHPSSGFKIYVIPDIPTAENLARHWFKRLAPAVLRRSDGRAKLLHLDVWETPNCFARFPGEGA